MRKKEEITSQQYTHALITWVENEWFWTKTTDNLIHSGKAPKWVNNPLFRDIRDYYLKFITVPAVSSSLYGHYWILINKPLLNELRKIHHIEQTMEWMFNPIPIHHTPRNLEVFQK